MANQPQPIPLWKSPAPASWKENYHDHLFHKNNLVSSPELCSRKRSRSLILPIFELEIVERCNFKDPGFTKR